MHIGSNCLTWHVQAYVAATASIGLMVYIFNSYASLKSHSDDLTRPEHEFTVPTGHYAGTDVMRFRFGMFIHFWFSMFLDGGWPTLDRAHKGTPS